MKMAAFSPDFLHACCVQQSDFSEARNSKRLKLSATEDDSHITVERNRRRQMNQHLNHLRSLMPCFYVKRGDQASIIGGVVDYITELQQILRTLEAKKQRKLYTDLAHSPRLVSSPRKPPVSPRLVPISPRTPQPASPYRLMLPPFIPPSPNCNELVAHSRSIIGEVEAKFVGGNLLVKTCCSRMLVGQTTKIIEVLEKLSLEVLEAKISVVDEAMVNCFTVKIGVGCQLSVEELVQYIQETLC